MPVDIEQFEENGKEDEQEAKQQHEPASKNEPASDGLTREQLEALRRKLHEKFH